MAVHVKESRKRTYDKRDEKSDYGIYLTWCYRGGKCHRNKRSKARLV